jgi:hypothetical protein
MHIFHIITVLTYTLLLNVATSGLNSPITFHKRPYSSPSFAVTSYESGRGQDQDLGNIVPPYVPNWPMLLDMCEISSLCDADPAEVGQILKQQGRRNVRVEQRTLDSLGVRFNIIEYTRGDTDRKRVLSIRGTKTLNNILQNMDAQLTFYEDLGVKAHRGYSEIARAMAEEIIDDNLLVIDELPLLLTGHSLGGAVSVLLANLLTRRGFAIEGVYTFGMPKFVDKEGALLLKQNLRIVQIEHVLDPICAGTNQANNAVGRAAPALVAASEAVPPFVRGLLQPALDAVEGAAGNFLPEPLLSPLILFVPRDGARANTRSGNATSADGNGTSTLSRDGKEDVTVKIDEEARQEWLQMPALNSADGPRSSLPPVPAVPSLVYHSMRTYEDCIRRFAG